MSCAVFIDCMGFTMPHQVAPTVLCLDCLLIISYPLMQTVDNDLALKIYIKARATPKVVAAFAERREFDKILIYSKQVCFF